jgi:hypothetical protein
MQKMSVTIRRAALSRNSVEIDTPPEDDALPSSICF